MDKLNDQGTGVENVGNDQESEAIGNNNIIFLIYIIYYNLFVYAFTYCWLILKFLDVI